MDNKLIVGLIVGGALVVGFAAGRFTAPTETLVKETGEKSSGKTKVATTKRNSYRPPNVSAKAGAPAEAQPDASAGDTNRFGRGRGGFDPAAYAAMAKERAVSARSNLFASVSMSPAQQQDFEDLVTAMNGSFKQRAEKMQALMQNGQPPSPELRYRMLAEYASTMLRSYEVMDRTMPAGWREKVGSNFDLRDMMDPALREATRGFSRGGGGPTGGGPGGGRGGPPQQ